MQDFTITKKQQINSVFSIFRIICAYAEGWQAEKTKQMSEENEGK